MESQSYRLAGPLTVLFAAMLGACSESDTTHVDAEGERATGVEQPPSLPQNVEWKDVAPIFAERCAGCHQAEGIAPFALTDYATASTWAAPAAAAVQARVMPPWLMTDDGSCNNFRDSRWLSDAEIALISAWAEDGAPRGSEPPEVSLPAVDHLADTTSFYTPEFQPVAGGGQLDEFDEYRCFPLGDATTEPTFLTGYEILPGNDALVHHVLVMAVNENAVVDENGTTNGEAMAALDAQSPDRLGWPCFGMAGEGVWNDSVPVTWAPGMGPVEYPAGVGVQLAPGTVLVAQVHYNMSQPGTAGQSDQTEVRLRFADEVERPGFFDLPDGFLAGVFDANPDTLPGGQAEVPYTWQWSLNDYFEFSGMDELRVYGVFPHMHELGRKQRMTLVRGNGDENCLGDVPRWDFNWQLFYFLDEPVTIRPGDDLRVRCDYDTTSRSGPVLPGWGTQNEMCLAGLLLAP